MEQFEFLCTKVWKSKDGDAMFATDDKERMIWTRDQALWPNLKAGNNIKCFAEPPTEGKKAYKLLSVGDDAPQKTGHIVKEAVKTGATVIDSTTDTRIRSMSLSYSKDLVIANKIELKDIIKYSDRFIDYILNIKRKETKEP